MTPPAAFAPRTVHDVIVLYLNHSKGGQAPRTYAGRRQVLDEFSAVCGYLDLAEAKPYHLRLWVDGRESWRSDWTRRRVIATVQCAFNWAVKLGLTGRNPFVGVAQPEGEAGRPLTSAEFAAMLRGVDALFRRVLIFLRFTGCRPCEMSALEWSHLDPARGCATMNKHKTARSRRDRRPRVLILHPVVLALVAWIRRGRPHERYVFVNAKGGAWNRNALGLRLYRLRARMGLEESCKFYGLRHAFATQAITNGVELKTVAELLGHTTTRITERYVHLAGKTDHLRAAVGRVMGKGA